MVITKIAIGDSNVSVLQLVAAKTQWPLEIEMIDRFVQRTFSSNADSSVEQESRTLKFMQSLNFLLSVLFASLAVPKERIMKICIERETIYLKSNYLKHLRGLPQSPWSINGVRKIYHLYKNTWQKI